jgi:pilus assembly protein CpaF
LPLSVIRDFQHSNSRHPNQALNHPPSLTRANNIEGKGAVSVRQLFSNMLRMRPTRIILGEIRGEEALDYLQAINSGHDGTLAVLHTSTPAGVVGRLETMAMYAGQELPSSELRHQIPSGLNLILEHEQMADGFQKITCLTEIGGIREDGETILNDLFRFEITGRADAGEVMEEFKLVNRPTNLARFKKRGVSLDEIFPASKKSSPAEAGLEIQRVVTIPSPWLTGLSRGRTRSVDCRWSG